VQCEHDVTREGLASMLIGWMKSFISQYTAKQILEHHCAKHLASIGPSYDVQVSLVGVTGE
jgi:hypothetical protein